MDFIAAIFSAREYLFHLAILVGIYLILAQGFNLCFGVARMFNLAHVAAYAIGAYTAALLATDYEVGFWWCLIASALVCSVFSLLIGAIALRLTQDYFAIGTLAFSSVVSALLINWKSLTRGVLGIPGIPRPVVGGLELVNNSAFLGLVAAIDVVVLALCFLLFRNRFNRSLRALAEHEGAAQALGRPAAQLRTVTFMIGSALAGIAGALFAFYINYIDPSSFALNEMIFVLTIAVVGRPGSYWGVIAATVFLVLLPEPLRFIDLPPSILGPMRQLLYAVILFGVVFWQRARLFPVERQI